MSVLMQIEKNEEAGVPEAMRVIKDDGLYLVQSYSEVLKAWITQAEWKEVFQALKDCANWYLK